MAEDMDAEQSARISYKLVIDCSASMSGILGPLVDGVKRQLEGTSLPVDVCLFNTSVDFVTNVSKEEAIRILSDVRAAGETALHDAVAQAGSHALESVPVTDGVAKVVFLVVTDGHDNKSKPLSAHLAKETVARMRGRGWRVVFMGANQDAFVSGPRLGVDLRDSITFTPNRQNVEAVFRSLSCSTERWTKNQDAAFTESEREASAGFHVKMPSPPTTPPVVRRSVALEPRASYRSLVAPRATEDEVHSSITRTRLVAPSADHAVQDLFTT
jgi:hypothetical protein